MGIREKLNQNPALVAAACGVLVVAAIVFIVWQIKGSTPAGVTDKLWYTTDDGQSYFHDLASKDPPFQVNGKDAVQAFVYKCPGTKPWVAYMQRYTPEALKMFAAARASHSAVLKGADAVGKENVEVKKPGDKEWLKLSEDRDKLKPVITVTCPDGTRNQLDPVY